MRTITGGHRVRVAAAGLALALTAGGVSTALAVPVGPPPVVASAGAPAATPAAPATTGDEGRRIVQAAPWPLSRADTDFYKMVLLPDGFPGVRRGGRVVAHPIYGVYLLRAFLRDYRRTHDVRDRRALAVLGQAVRARMRPFHGALVFWYDAATSVQLTKSGGRVYSALTQAYYMDVLSDVGVELHDAGLRSTA
ncbi:MAG TPA: hypothetical protein VE781_15565, partial [Kineosporiaceae bacterium]|nr:hypothetical protein [Kineosporiaceae bacterium]